MRRHTMNTVTLDTYELIKEFKEAGFNEKQAEVQAHAAQVVFQAAVEQSKEDVNFKQLATLWDLKQVESTLRLETEKLRSELYVNIEKVRGEIDKSKVTVILWVFGMLVAQMGVLVGLFNNAIGIL